MKVNFFASPLIPGDVKYSLFAKKVTLRGTTSGMKIESLNERWFEAMMTGPDDGTFRRPRTLGRKRRVRIGSKKDRIWPNQSVSLSASYDNAGSLDFISFSKLPKSPISSRTKTTFLSFFGISSLFSGAD